MKYCASQDKWSNKNKLAKQLFNVDSFSELPRRERRIILRKLKI